MPERFQPKHSEEPHVTQGLNVVASILAAGVLRLRAKRNLSDTRRRDKRSPKTDLISTSERSGHNDRKQR